ncbi:NAD(P)/FAD-dependent oxidoreductase [Nitratiruptor tergarcus]|uniref:tRNA 5-methylaminomethyl-2-thiouridine biosynthesis bifunctional protein n=1 Tax=Nitratiruptor tergarcus DSM 16512 TaxID=1069081 RepID=A0A1W1WTE0_9BACT|nr:FAD-binding oxidoreductase [Nitratiruptor tergarcus]SMC09472.1 tRNA 5-methylaminomethyl-2-thiouridine biosynthesis bifunctional protein [Nitratiruptor tergarcus DSM 16512]
MIYDFVVIGGGSAGVHTAHFLLEGGAKVALVEQSEIGAGGSGAAGAFISPRIGKGSDLQRITNEAFKFAVDFYKNAPFFYQTGLLRLPKDNQDFTGLEKFLDIPFSCKEGRFFFPEAGILKAKKHLQSLAHKIPLYKKYASIEQRSDYFDVGDVRAKKVVVATGSYDELIDEPYIRIGKLGGVRFDVKTALSLPYCMHKRVSISVNIDGIVSIGATHNREGATPQPPSMLFEEARKMVGAFSYEIAQMYCGVRSSVSDHFPIIGELIDTKSTPRITNFKKLDLDSLPRKNIYIINGLGGRGFVFGPYVAKILAEHLLKNAPIPKELSLDRYFIRYLKKGRV